MKNKLKSNRNKTIDFTLENSEKYLKACVDEKLLEKISPSSIVIGDTFSALEKIEKNSVDLLIVDPPYNLDKEFHGDKFRKTDLNEYEEYTNRWLNLCLPLLKDTASVYVCCDWFSSLTVGKVLAEKLILRNRITWQREKGRGAKKNWKNSMEDIFFATKSDNFTFNLDAVKQRKKVLAPYKEDGVPKDWEQTKDGNYRDTCPSNFWDDIAVPYWSMAENTAHPTQKPEKLIAKLILASSNDGDVVLDAFMGSGTTCVTASKLNRKYIGIEQNPLYSAWAAKRLEMAKEDKVIQGYEDGVFWERNSKPNKNKK